jgi:hypothetical protein
VTQEQGARDGNGDQGRRTCCETLAEASCEMRRHDAPRAPSVPSRSIDVSHRSCTKRLLHGHQSPNTLVTTMLIAAILCDVKEFCMISPCMISTVNCSMANQEA